MKSIDNIVTSLAKYGKTLDEARTEAEADIQDDMWDELVQDLYDHTTVEVDHADDGTLYIPCFDIEQLKKYWRLERK